VRVSAVPQVQVRFGVDALGPVVAKVDRAVPAGLLGRSGASGEHRSQSHPCQELEFHIKSPLLPCTGRDRPSIVIPRRTIRESVSRATLVRFRPPPSDDAAKPDRPHEINFRAYRLTVPEKAPA
jgi:hypothetical protein